MLLASDSYLSDLHLGVTIGSKLFTVGNIGFGYASNMRHGQVIRHQLHGLILDDLCEPGHEEEWGTNTLVPAIESLDLDREDDGLSLLVAIHGKLFTLQDDLAFYRSPLGYAAIGSGCAVALGAMHAHGTVSTAVQAAKLHVPSCGGNVHQLWVPNEVG